MKIGQLKQDIYLACDKSSHRLGDSKKKRL